MNIRWILKFFILFICVYNLSGCAVGVIAAGVGAAKWGTSKKQNSYNQYIQEMNEINFKREKAHLKPEPIIPYKEYST